MFNKLLLFIQASSYVQYFIIGFVTTIGLSVLDTFSFIMLTAVVLSVMPIIVNLPLFNDRLEYDQKQQLILIPLLFSSILWSVYMWSSLQDYPQLLTLVFVVIASAALLVMQSLKQKLFIFVPVLIIYLLLLTLNSLLGLAIFVATLSLVLFYFDNTRQVTKEQIDHTPSNNQTANNKELTSELDMAKTNNKQLQDKLKQMEIDLSAAEMAKMEFLATMSHEIRTPLNGIIPLLDILLDSEMSNFQRDYLSTAHVAAIQMQKLIDDLLDYSKVEAGKLTVETRGLKVPRIIEAVKSSYKQAANKKNIKMEVNIHSNISPLLRGDPTRLRQVLSNLVSNAIKFSSTGTIKLEAKKIKDYPNKEIVRFKVVDQGIGLDKETSDNIFLAFTQEDASSTRKFGGTGLGLAISKKIVELMHGTIGVESKKGIGSTFYFDLPLLKSVGETTTGLKETSGYQAILVNTNPLLFNKISRNLKAEQVSFKKALGLAQAYEIYASINKISKQKKNILVFIDFETAGKHVRSLCNDLAKDPSMNNLFACVLTDNKSIAGIPQKHNIKLLTKDDSIAELLDKISVAQASLGADCFKAVEELTSETVAIKAPQAGVIANLVPEILLVEDNEVNLKVAEKLIQYIGYPFDFAMNGMEALAKVKQTRYRMILMDCQMPVMDGYRCTAKIRAYEAAAGLNHTPILAMTANAMMGDREKCLEAGMDDYMSKPLNRYILEKTLKKWDPLAAKHVAKPITTTQNPTVIIKKPAVEKTTRKRNPININQKWLSTKILFGLEEIMGEEIVQLLNMFELETPSIIKKINTALNNNNFADVKKMAHMLKSTSSNVGANGLSFFSRKLELAADNKDKQQLLIIFAKIKKAYMLTSKEIIKYING
ncbi:MAG: ATP-binding protein [Proteobacteria bacterium]|nr:ATP-binding protein [Pseudomonadota bacterium]